MSGSPVTGDAGILATRSTAGIWPMIGTTATGTAPTRTSLIATELIESVLIETVSIKTVFIEILRRETERIEIEPGGPCRRIAKTSTTASRQTLTLMARWGRTAIAAVAALTGKSSPRIATVTRGPRDTIAATGGGKTTRSHRPTPSVLRAAANDDAPTNGRA